MVKLKFSEVSNHGFAQAVQKIATAPVHGEVASKIHRVVRHLTRVRREISAAYQAELVEKFSKRDEKGVLIRPEGEPLGFEPDEAKTDEFMKAQEAFGTREVELDCLPITVQMLSDIKVSASDLEALKGLYAGNNLDPELPPNVAAFVKK